MTIGLVLSLLVVDLVCCYRNDFLLTDDDSDDDMNDNLSTNEEVSKIVLYY